MEKKITERLITDGFVLDQDPGVIHFAQFEPQQDGLYMFKIGNIDSQICQLVGGMRNLNLDQAIEQMDDWEGNLVGKSAARVDSSETGISARNFREAARQMKIPVGAEEKSLHHAARAKRTRIARRRMKGPGV